jgi:peptidoglycan/LPS O-acetylase OafA/YrhL
MPTQGVTYRNIQGLRAIAALMVFASHLFWDIEPMRSHWARPFLNAVGPSGVDIFFVVSGFIIWHVARRSAAHVDALGRAGVLYEFAMKRAIRIYPLYWTVFAVAALIAVWVPVPPSFIRKPQVELFFLIDGIPNFRVQAAWTLTFEMAFYAVTALSLFLLPRRPFVGLVAWFAVTACLTVVAQVVPVPIRLDYMFAPTVLEFALGMAVALAIDRGTSRLARTALLVGAVWLLVGAAVLQQDGGRAAQSYLLRLVSWGVPAGLIVYGAAALEARRAWIMPRALKYLGDASYSIYLWHAVMFIAIAAAFAKLGWTGQVNRSVLALLMASLAMGISLLSYHFLERKSQAFLTKRLLTRRHNDACPQSARLAPLPATGHD